MPTIIEKTAVFATDLLTNQLDAKYLYHNLKHTTRVVKNTEELSNAHSLNVKEKEVLLLAAWLHDTGYTKGPDNHEENSCSIAEVFLGAEEYSKDQLNSVCELIKATKRYHEPKTLFEKIIRDADASHFSKKSYLETSEKLCEELALLNIAVFTPKDWCIENIKMMQKEHRYYTDYAKENWQAGKEKNLKKLLKSQKIEDTIAKKEALKAKYKTESPDRSVQTLFRVTLKNHLKLSDIADTKANILLSVNAIVISMALSNLIPKLDNPSNVYLIYPTVIFIVFSIISMVLSILATRPNVTSGKFSKEDVNEKRVNLLFFGNFHKMKLTDYEWAIKELTQDKEYVYSSLTKDLYFLGKVLDRKYKILWWTYTIFMIGMVLSVIAFGISFKFFGPDRVLQTTTAMLF